MVVAFLTTFYMFRLVFVVFWGRAKSDLPAHAHESPPVMTYPLIGLAVASVVAGGLGIGSSWPAIFWPRKRHVLAWWLISFRHDRAWHEPIEGAGCSSRSTARLVPALCGLVAMLLGFLAAWGLYAQRRLGPAAGRLPGSVRVLRNKFYFDELYAWIIACTQDAMARFAALFDREISGRRGAVRFTAERSFSGAACAWPKPATCKPTPSCSRPGRAWCSI